MHHVPCVTERLTVDEFLDWTPPEGYAKHRWHLIDGEPVLMPMLDVEQGVLLAEACGVFSARLRRSESDLRLGTMPAVQSGENRRNMYVTALGATRSRPIGARIMPNPEFLMEIRGPENWALVRLGVFMMQQAPSAEEILVLDSTAVRAWLHRRRDSREWDDPVELRGDDVLHLRSLGVEVTLSRFYHCVDIRPREQREATESAAADVQMEGFTAVPHPGEVIKSECLSILGLSVDDAAAHLGVSRSRLADVVAGVDRIDADLAVRLGMAFKRREHEWLRLQQDHDLAQVRRDEMEIPYLVTPHLDMHWDDYFDAPGTDLGPRLQDEWIDKTVPREGVATYWCLLDRDQTGCRVWVPDLPRCTAQAATVPLALVEAACAAEVRIARLEASGLPVPPPSTSEVLKERPVVVLALSGGAEVRLLPVRTGRVALADV